MARLHNVQIQVLPFNARAFAGRIVYRFTLLTIPAPGIASPLEFVYVESYDDARYLDDKDAVWTAVGDARSEPECLAHIERVWTDMRPLSLRLRMRADAG